MKKFFLFLLISLVSVNSFAQKMYVWEPKQIEVKPKVGFLEGDTIILAINDSRVMSKKSKIEYTSEEFVNHLKQLILSSYPSATIICDNSKYYKKASKTAITIKIGIAAYHAGFGTDIVVGIGSIGGSFASMVVPKGKWNAMTAYTVKIIDNRNGEQSEQSNEFSGLDSASNTFGYTSAKKCLTNSYISATQKLLNFIDNVLME